MSSFDRYKAEFSDIMRDIEGQLHQEKDVSESLSQCDVLIKQMALEARGASDPSTKQALMDILSACKMQLQSYKTLNEKMELLSATNVKDRMQSTREMATSQNERLEGALRSLRETEEVASAIGEELSKNRKTLENTQGNVGKMSAMTQDAKGLLGSMMKKWWQP